MATMRLVTLLVVLGLTSCSGQAVAPPPAPGTSACDGQPHGTCILCSDSKWHCSGNGTAYQQCPGSGCVTGEKPCVSCTNDGTGTLQCAQVLNPGGDHDIEETTIAVTCSP